jgi:tRNA modification GTPase
MGEIVTLSLRLVTDLDHTICAIATPVGIGGVGIVRLAGPDALAIAKKVCPKVKHWEPRYVALADICDDLGVLDQGCIVFFKGPQSYTGDDIVEFQLHSNPHLLKRVLEVLVGYGARLATAGEFTKRAFLNGRLDLSQAESVGELIHANSDMSRQAALGRLKGRLFRLVSIVRHQLMGMLEQVEGSVDFPDEVPAIPRDELIGTIEGVLGQLKPVLAMQDYGRRIEAGVTCVIMGRPNVGKSSLMNALLGENRAIVTSIAGTTRDFIDVSAELGGVAFRFVDTAGIREMTSDVIEKLGIRKITQLVKHADLILWVVDGSMALTEDDFRVLESLPKRKPVMIVVNKADKRQNALKGLPLRKNWKQLAISAKRGDGVQTLKQALCEWVYEGMPVSDLDLMCNVRQLAVLRTVVGELEHLLGCAHAGLEDDVLSIDLKRAILSLGEFTGEEVTEEMLDGVFAKFCVGK